MTSHDMAHTTARNWSQHDELRCLFRVVKIETPHLESLSLNLIVVAADISLSLFPTKNMITNIIGNILFLDWFDSFLADDDCTPKISGAYCAMGKYNPRECSI